MARACMEGTRRGRAMLKRLRWMEKLKGEIVIALQPCALKDRADGTEWKPFLVFGRSVGEIFIRAAGGNKNRVADGGTRIPTNIFILSFSSSSEISVCLPWCSLMFIGCLFVYNAQSVNSLQIIPPLVTVPTMPSTTSLPVDSTSSFNEKSTQTPPSPPENASQSKETPDLAPLEDFQPPFTPGRGFRLAFLSLCIVTLAAALDATSLSIALPIITERLDGTAIEAFWSGTSFLVTSAVFQPVIAGLSHIFGRKQVWNAALLHLLNQPIYED